MDKNTPPSLHSSSIGTITMSHFELVAGAGPGLVQTLLKRLEADSYQEAGLSRFAPSTTINIQSIDLYDRPGFQKKLPYLITLYGAPKWLHAIYTIGHSTIYASSIREI